MNINIVAAGAVDREFVYIAFPLGPHSTTQPMILSAGERTRARSPARPRARAPAHPRDVYQRFVMIFNDFQRFFNDFHQFPSIFNNFQ